MIIITTRDNTDSYGRLRELHPDATILFAHIDEPGLLGRLMNMRRWSGLMNTEASFWRLLRAMDWQGRLQVLRSRRPWRAPPLISEVRC